MQSLACVRIHELAGIDEGWLAMGFIGIPDTGFMSLHIWPSLSLEGAVTLTSSVTSKR